MGYVNRYPRRSGARQFFSRLFGIAAVIGFETTFGRDRVDEFELDPATGRETLLSLITRKQNELRGPR